MKGDLNSYWLILLNVKIKLSLNISYTHTLFTLLYLHSLTVYHSNQKHGRLCTWILLPRDPRSKRCWKWSGWIILFLVYCIDHFNVKFG